MVAWASTTALLGLLGLFAAVFLAIWGAHLLATRRRGPAGPDESGPGRVGVPSAAQLAIGFVTNFFDTLGIGSMAPTTALYRLGRVVPDRLIPGTMNVGHALPTVAQAFIYIGIMKVEVRTLAPMIASACLGAWLGSGIVAGWSRRRVQIGMGTALLVASGLLVAQLLHVLPQGQAALGLRGAPLAIAVAGNFVLGALITIGVGSYAPTLILLGLLGLSPAAIFPIMMGSCAFLVTVSGARFVRRGSYAARPALGLTLAGVPAVLIAAYLVKSLPLDVLRWLVVGVVLYTSATMLWSALRPARPAAEAVRTAARVPLASSGD